MTSRKKRIINGEEAEIEEFPYLVQLHVWHGNVHDYRYKLWCGGTIVGPKYVLSAAHCLVNTKVIIQPYHVQIHYGTKYIYSLDDYEFLDVVYYEIHGEYDYITNQNDISILKVINYFTCDVHSLFK